MPWSDWIPGETVGIEVGPTYAGDGNAHSIFRQDGVDGAAADDVTVEIEAARAAVVANTGASFDSDTAMVSAIITYAFATAHKDETASGGTVLLGTGVTTFEGSSIDPASTYDWFPAYLDDLTEDVDYGGRPDRSPTDDDYYVEYDSGSSPTALGWAAWSPRIRLFTSWATGPLLPTPPATLPFSVQFSWADPVADLDLWYDPSAGTLMTDATIDPAEGSSTTFALIPVDMTGVPLDWSLLMHNNYFTDSFAGSDYAPPSSGSIDDGLAFQAALILQGGVSPYFSTAVWPKVSFALPEWRYWIPDDKLRTVGDHFRSVGGADVKSLIPGVGWVKVRRGT